MDNYTGIDNFHILLFSNIDGSRAFIIGAFAFIYLIGVLMNLAIFTLICSNNHLHSPMYLFLCNLSFVDICYTTITIPKLLAMLLSRHNTVSFTQCFIQMFLLFTVATTEDLLLLIMAYDRYVAIWNPLRYHHLLSKKMCFLFTSLAWLSGCLNSSQLTMSATKMSFCHSNTIHSFYCDINAMKNIACGGTEMLYGVINVSSVLLGFVPFVCSLISYTQIVKIVLSIKTSEGRRKAFSTCSSHLTVIIIFYWTATTVYVIPSSEQYYVLEQVFTVLYTTIIPMLNPLIYSLKNKDVKWAVVRLLCNQHSQKLK
ncbi:TPA: hypothetical protein GDO54_018584 [Pyxicephalus adspersus]|uniref:G-protein coupled receptors family 1 profile domain-containing protein n=1 Tax=Pyxicephalus adspersus TaxID=30357 RepID=A0AAV2ZMI6_PYXAD|nr:TPA: hypothetical protein GDO54_018584 [Pyxicephalus adspersus]